MPNVSNVYDLGSVLRSSLGSRGGLSVPPPGDFGADLRWMVRELGLDRLGRSGGGNARTQSRILSQPSYESGSGVAAHNVYPNPDYSRWTPAQFGRKAMSPQGVWGTYIDPVNVPLALQGVVPTGFFASDTTSNYGYSPLAQPPRYPRG